MLAFNKNEIYRIFSTKKKVFFFMLLFSAAINLLMLTPTIYMLQVYDRVLASRNEYTLLMLTLMVVMMLAVMALLEYSRSMIAVRISAQFDAALNVRIYNAVYEKTLSQNHPNAAQSLGDMTQLRQFLTGSALFAFFDAPWFPLYLGVIFLFSPWLGLLALAGALTLLALALINEKITHSPLKEANHLSCLANSTASSSLQNAEVIEALGMLPNLRARWLRLHHQFVARQQVASEYAAAITNITKYVRLSLQSLVLGLGGWLAINGQISPGMMIAGSVLLGRALAPIEQLIGVWKNWHAAKGAWQRLTKLLEAYPVKKEQLSLPAPVGKLTVDRVSMTPPGASVSVLNDLSFSLQPGDVLGIIGPSACGKSTLARLLAGIWPASEGSVRLDDADIYQWNKEELGPAIGYLPQDIELFAGTIAENIGRFNQPDAEKTIAAAKMAGVHEMIMHFPEGYDTVIGHAGQGLSGGQKQRIALARTLYGNPSFIVMDEPNSNLDEMGERALAQAILQLREAKKTVLFITHRRQMLGITTKILLLNKGKIVAFGPSQEVMKSLQTQSVSPTAVAKK